jgi:5-methylcytosine-specific restriction enzyme subunit McrC
MDDLVISEQTEWFGELAPADFDFLMAEFNKQLTLRCEIRNGTAGAVLRPNQFVGVLALPSGRNLRIIPKVPVRNLVYMIAYGSETWPFRDEQLEADSIDEVLWVFAQIFADLVQDRIEEGLYRSYVEREDSQNLIRGRIVFPEDIRRNLLTRHKTYCRFSEFTWDIEENQLIRQVVHFLSGFQLPDELRKRLTSLDAELAEITPTNLGPSVISRFRYNRFNESYQPIHQLCQLFLEGASLNEDVGTWNSRAFLIDMNKLFEDFVSHLLIRNSSGSISVLQQAEMRLDCHGLVRMRPDLLISENELIRVAADCKYKKAEDDDYKQADYYQVLAYCVACGANRGMIIYPKYVDVAQDAIAVANSDIVIERRTLDLSLELPEFKVAAQNFANGVLATAASGTMVSVA